MLHCGAVARPSPGRRGGRVVASNGRWSRCMHSVGTICWHLWLPATVSARTRGGRQSMSLRVGKSALLTSRCSCSQTRSRRGPQDLRADLPSRVRLLVQLYAAILMRVEMAVAALIPIDAVRFELRTWEETRWNISGEYSFASSFELNMARIACTSPKPPPDPWVHVPRIPQMYAFLCSLSRQQSDVSQIFKPQGDLAAVGDAADSCVQALQRAR